MHTFLQNNYRLAMTVASLAATSSTKSPKIVKTATNAMIMNKFRFPVNLTTNTHKARPGGSRSRDFENFFVFAIACTFASHSILNRI